MKCSKWVTLGFGALCLVAVAGVLNSPHLYYMAAILLTLPAVSYGLGWFALRGLAFTREVPTSAWAGEGGGIVYGVQNTSSVPRFFLTVDEPLPAWIVPMDDEPILFNVDARDTTRFVHPVRFLKRGVHRTESFRVSALDPLGVFEFSRHVACESELVVYPVPSPIQSVILSGSERYGARDFTTLAFHGGSIEPDGVRLYVPGDPLRRIHWRQTARTGRLSVIEFEETQSVNLVIALDLSAGPAVGKDAQTPLEYAVRLAASLAQMAVQFGASARLAAQLPLDDETTRPVYAAAAQAGRGQDHMFLIMDALARADDTASQSLASVLSDGASRVLPGTTVVALVCRPDFNLAGVMARYRAAGATVIVTFVDPKSFEGGRGAVRLSDEQLFFAELSAIGAHLFRVQCNEQSELRLEAYAYAESTPPAAARAVRG